MSNKYELGALNYHSALSYLESRRSNKIDYNTYLEYGNDNTIIIRLYATAIVRFFPDGAIQLSTGGWDTPTTKERISQSVEGIYLHVEKGDLYFNSNGTEYFFHDGVIIQADGSTDAVRTDIESINSIVEEEISSEEDVARLISSCTLKGIKSLWRRCKKGKALIAYYAPIAFIPLIVPRASGTEYWYPTAMDRLING